MIDVSIPANEIVDPPARSGEPGVPMVEPRSVPDAAAMDRASGWRLHDRPAVAPDGLRRRDAQCRRPGGGSGLRPLGLSPAPGGPAGPGGASARDIPAPGHRRPGCPCLVRRTDDDEAVVVVNFSTGPVRVTWPPTRRSAGRGDRWSAPIAVRPNRSQPAGSTSCPRGRRPRQALTVVSRRSSRRATLGRRRRC